MKQLLLLVFMVLTAKSFGQSAAQLQAQLGNKQKRMWGITLVNTTSTTILEPDDYRSNTNSTLTAIYRYNFGTFRTRLMVSGNKDLTGARQDRFTTAFAEISKTVGFLSGESVTTIFQGRAHPAVNDERRFNESHRGAFSGGLLFIINPGHPNFQVIGVSRVTKNIHEFEINRDAGYNNSVNLMNYVAVSYFPNSKWEIGVNATLVQGWDYRGESGESSLFLGQSLGYTYSKNINITVGHELGGRTFGYDQNNLDLNLFDEDQSSVYASLTYNY